MGASTDAEAPPSVVLVADVFDQFSIEPRLSIAIDSLNSGEIDGIAGRSARFDLHDPDRTGLGPQTLVEPGLLKALRRQKQIGEMILVAIFAEQKHQLFKAN
jgi:hypothetical protein